MRMKIFFRLLLSLYIVNCTLYVHAQPDTTKPQTNYRRTDPNNPPPTTSYTQLPKEQVFPLGWNRGTFGKVTSGTGTWTELNPKVPRVDYIGLHFINSDTGWACGGSGAIIETTNGGDDWTISETPTTNLLLKIHSYNGQLVICTGYDGLILRSSDGGETFEQVVSGVGNGTDLWGVQMLNDTLGWVCGMNQTLLKTTDAGLSWQQVFSGLNQHYWSLNFLDESYGMIACGGGMILKTTNGGNSWLQRQTGDNRDLYTIDLIDSLHTAAAGEYGNEMQYEGGKNVYSSDGGETWILNPDVPTYDDANWIEFADTDTGYTINVNYGIYKTTNRGQSWVGVGGGGEWHIEMVGYETGYSGGDGLNIYKRTDGQENWSKFFLNVNWNDVFFVSEIKGFFIGDVLEDGLYFTEDEGLIFRKIENSPGGNVITFINANIGFIGGRSYTRIYNTIDSGITWSLVNISGLTDTVGRINKMFFVNPTNGWAVANGILKTTDYGFNWFAQLNAPFSGITSIHFVDSLYGWATDVGHRPYKTTDGGLNWIEQTNLNIWDSRDIYFRDYQNGYLIGYNELYNTTDGGYTWILNPIVAGFGIAELSSFEDSTVFIVGGKTFRSVDGGVNWFEFTELNGITLTGLSLLNSGFGFAVGSGGLILKYYDTTYVPVELISFRGELINEKVVLTWITASELNNYGFEVQKSFDKETWEKIGFVIGKGTSTEISYYSFTHSILKSGKSYYRLKQVDYDGTYKYSEVIEVEASTPKEFSLKQNFPNPFNNTTAITFQIPKDYFVVLKIYDVLGNELKTLIQENKKAGDYTITFSTDDLSSGIYFYKLTAGEYKSIKKLMLLK